MRPLRALLLDLDGTLLDGSGLQESIRQTCEFIAASQPGLDASRLVEANAKIWREYWQDVEREWMLGELTGSAVSREAWRRTLSACGCNNEALVNLASETHHKLGRQAHRLFDDAQEVCRSMKQAGVPLALVTNGASDTQREKLQVLGIHGWFDTIVISGEVKVAKPDEAVFRLALDGLGVERRGVWHVGDSLTTDVAGARAAGLVAVWLNRGRSSRSQADPEPDLEIQSLLDLLSLQDP